MRVKKQTYEKLMNNSLNYKTNKYHNKKVIIDGIEFDSKKEGTRYLELKYMQKAKLIKELELQKTFLLLESFTDNQGKQHRPTTYICDFYYYDEVNKNYIAEDVKSKATAKDKVYCIKKKMFMHEYPNIIFKEII